jgi:predicted nuclease of predicted toxin-antitoxin system
MKLRFLVDAQRPIALARWLTEEGLEADHVHDLNLADAPDSDIWKLALQVNAVIVTKDEDFVLPGRKRPCPQVIWVRLGNCSKTQLLTRFSANFDEIRRGLAHGEQLIELR